MADGQDGFALWSALTADGTSQTIVEQDEVPTRRSSTSSIRAELPEPWVQEYEDLRRLVRERGLLKKQPASYVPRVLRNWAMLAVGVAGLVYAKSLWLQMLDGVYLAFVFGQIGFMGHDIAHGQVFREKWSNILFGLFHGNLLLGLSYGWWNDKHNRHHRHPNCVDSDPDVDHAPLAFTEGQALAKRGVARLVTKYQAFFLIPLLCMVAVSEQVQSMASAVHGRVRYAYAETFLLSAHIVLYLGVIFSLLGAWRGSLFIVVHQAFFGLYFGSVFAPNHKGMPMLENDREMDPLRLQILTARNIKPSPMTDFWYGGLNYQIEHHIFPSLPCRRLKEARELVKEFCREHSIPYCEVGLLRSYRDILRNLHEVSAVLRRPRICERELLGASREEVL